MSVQSEADQLNTALKNANIAGPKQARSGEETKVSGHPTILVLGAAGNTGAATIKSLYTYFRHQVSIRAGVRNVDKAKKAFTGLRGVDIVVADASDAASLKTALTGVDAVLITPPGNGNERAPAVTAFISAIKAIGTVKFVLFIAVPVTGNDKFIFGKEWGGYQAQLKATGVPFSWLQLPMFCENFWGNVGSIKGAKAIYAPIGVERHFNYISVNDVGDASAFILANYAQHKNTTYTLTGPATTSHEEILKELKPIVGEISFYTSTKEQTVDAITKAMGFPAWQAEGIVQLWEQCVNSSDGVDGREITKDFEKLTGKKPTSYADFLKSIAFALNDKFPAPSPPAPRPTILVSGATGNVGAATIKSLFTIYGMKVHVLAAVRDKEKGLKAFSSLQGLELIHYDTNKAETLEKALTDVDAVFIIPPNPGATTDRHASTLAQIAAAKKAGAKFILLLDLLVSGDKDLALGREWDEYVQAIQATGIPNARIAAPMFLENFWGSVGSLKGQNAFYFPVNGDIQYNYISVADVGVAAAAILAAPEKHHGKNYVLTGPVLATNNGVAKELSKLTGRTINFYQATPEQAVEAMKGFGFPEWQAKAVVELWDYHTRGKGKAQLVSNDFKDITGVAATDINDFLKQLAPAI